MKKLISVLTLVVCLAFVHDGFALKKARKGKADSRIQTFVYNPRDVYGIVCLYGFTTRITFRENIKLVTIGDKFAWSSETVRNHLILKPIEDNAFTNLDVITDKRVYSFQIEAHRRKGKSDKNMTYAINFIYPDEDNAIAKAKQDFAEEDKRKADERLTAYQDEKNRQLSEVLSPDFDSSPKDWNFMYKRKGSKRSETNPITVFDNKRFTYFLFSEGKPIPAIFLVEDKKESLINHYKEGQYIVVKRAGPEFILRRGKKSTRVINNAWDSQ